MTGRGQQKPISLHKDTYARLHKVQLMASEDVGHVLSYSRTLDALMEYWVHSLHYEQWEEVIGE